ncbi:hypothetical protein BMS3Bbin15_01273 [archaeon BMS3Bbin15]|nr:hypothetical protein BMS3Bbin15_01273 [archaeon BMS3Bbin15]
MKTHPAFFLFSFYFLLVTVDTVAIAQLFRYSSGILSKFSYLSLVIILFLSGVIVFVTAILFDFLKRVDLLRKEIRGEA